MSAAPSLPAPSLPAAALAELKLWLGISTTRDDPLLISLLQSATALCEAFTGLALIERDASPVLPVCGSWQALPLRPVRAITAVEGLPADGGSFALEPSAYAITIEADGTGWLRVMRPGSAGRVRVACRAGLAADWSGLPEALRHGIIRHAAHQHREREGAGGAAPPAAVAALWRPWRMVRLS